jgi:hypothetical protein
MLNNKLHIITLCTLLDCAFFETHPMNYRTYTTQICPEILYGYTICCSKNNLFGFSAGDIPQPLKYANGLNFSQTGMQDY